MMPDHQTRKLLKGTLILTLAALLTKILSAFYRIPFQNIVGDVGFYIYQQVYPFYGISVALSTYGFPVVLSKLYALETAKKEKGNVKQLFAVSSVFLFSIGMLCFFALYLGAERLAGHMNDRQLAPLLRTVSWVFLWMPFISLFRGFFQGDGDMIPTAVSQISEQLVRVATILGAAWLFMRYSASLYTVGKGAVFGSVTGGLVAMIILLVFWLQRRAGILPQGTYVKGKTKAILSVFIIEGLTICVSSMLLILIQLADALNLYSLLLQSGVGAEEAKQLKGIYDRGQPLIQLGTVVATSMSLALVPLITKEKAQENDAILQEKIASALKISILVGAGATMGLWNIIQPTNIMLFENGDGSSVLALLSTIILLGSVIMTVTAILQGLGSSVFPAVIIASSLIFKYGANILFINKHGLAGAALASIVTLLLILLLLLLRLYQLTGPGLLQKRFLFMVMFAGAAMTVVLQWYLHLTGAIYDVGGSVRLWAGVQALSAVVLGGSVYLLLLLRGRVFKEEELLLLPFGSKLLKLLPKRMGDG